jgi:hypothetical protein
MSTLPIVIAAAAFAVSLAQWFSAWNNERIRLLLGAKETVAFEAIRVADGKLRTSRRTYEALVLASLLERSDRARIVIYRALDEASDRRRDRIREFRRDLMEASQKYEGSIDRNSFDVRLDQLDRAIPWIAD